MQTATQASVLPTRKLSIGATFAPVIAIYSEPAVAEVWASVAPAVVVGPNATNLVAALFGAGIAMAVAWWVPDAPNTMVLK